MGCFDYRTWTAAALIDGWMRRGTSPERQPRQESLPRVRAMNERLNDLVVGQELLFQTLHLVLQAELQLLQTHFLDLFVFRKIFLLNQAFEALLVFRMFLRKTA